jgi:hypothetical protein
MDEWDEQTKKEDEEDIPVELRPYLNPKHNTHTFLNKVLSTKDSTKVGFLSESELGFPLHNVRAMQELSLWAKDVMNNPFVSDYFAAEGEITLATSLSRLGFLDKLAVTQTRQVADLTKPRAENKSWFKPKQPNKEEIE